LDEIIGGSADNADVVGEKEKKHRYFGAGSPIASPGRFAAVLLFPALSAVPSFASVIATGWSSAAAVTAAPALLPGNSKSRERPL